MGVQTEFGPQAKAKGNIIRRAPFLGKVHGRCGLSPRPMTAPCVPPCQEKRPPDAARRPKTCREDLPLGFVAGLCFADSENKIKNMKKKNTSSVGQSVARSVVAGSPCSQSLCSPSSVAGLRPVLSLPVSQSRCLSVFRTVGLVGSFGRSVPAVASSPASVLVSGAGPGVHPAAHPAPVGRGGGRRPVGLGPLVSVAPLSGAGSVVRARLSFQPSAGGVAASLRRSFLSLSGALRSVPSGVAVVVGGLRMRCCFSLSRALLPVSLRWGRFQSRLCAVYFRRVRQPVALWYAVGRPPGLMPRLPWWHQFLYSWLRGTGALRR